MGYAHIFPKLKVMRFINPYVFVPFLWLCSQGTATGQSSLDSLLLAIDSNNSYLRTGRQCVDSCRQLTKRKPNVLGRPQHRLAKMNRQSLQETERAYLTLQRKIHLQARLISLDLIYQRKRLRELTHRQQLMNELSGILLWRRLNVSTYSDEPQLNTQLRAITELLSQKERAIQQRQRELNELNGGQMICFPDTTYSTQLPVNGLLDRSKPSGVIQPGFEEWRSRYALLKKLLILHTRILQNRPSLRVILWELRRGQLSPEAFNYQFATVNELIDSRMRTERDMHIATIHLLDYAQKPFQSYQWANSTNPHTGDPPVTKRFR